MTTDLPVGTFFRHRYKNEPEYGRVVQVQGELCYRVIAMSDIPDGATVHKCVWTGTPREHLESRGTFVKAND